MGYCTGDAYLCCAGYDADPIDRDTSNCPTQSYCGSTTGCTAHRHCASTEYCYDTGFFITGVWNGEGQCSMWTYACCGNADADPIDRDVANCPASAGCTSVTSTASNCKEVCEDMNYGRTHCLAVSSSCSWDGTACKSSVGTGSCTYYPNQSSSAVPRIVNAVLAGWRDMPSSTLCSACAILIFFPIGRFYVVMGPTLTPQNPMGNFPPK